MPTTVYIPVEEYLSTSYRPDCDYVDGEVLERNVGTRPHSLLQSLLAQWFNDRFDQYGTVGFSEQRVQISETRFRIPDVCATLGDDGGDIVKAPPLVCIEILSPDDRLPNLQQKIDDYAQIGVQNVWVIDPVTHSIWVADGGTMRKYQGAELPVTGLHAEVKLVEVFYEFDRRLRSRRDSIVRMLQT